MTSISTNSSIHNYNSSITYREIESRWGDLQSGVTFEKARKALLLLDEQAYHPKN